MKYRTYGIGRNFKMCKIGYARISPIENNEALQMQSLLEKKGIRSRLIESTDLFRFCNLMEIRYLLKVIRGRLSSPVISDEIWNYAKQRLTEKYPESACLENILSKKAS